MRTLARVPAVRSGAGSSVHTDEAVGARADGLLAPLAGPARQTVTLRARGGTGVSGAPETWWAARWSVSGVVVGGGREGGGQWRDCGN